MGDASDNVPGVKGVGEKISIALLKEYGDLDNVLANADKVPCLSSSSHIPTSCCRAHSFRTKPCQTRSVENRIDPCFISCL